MSIKFFCIGLVAAGVLALSPPAVQAHDPGLSAIQLRVESNRFVSHLAFSRSDIERVVPIDLDGNGLVEDDEIDKARSALNGFAAGALELRVNGNPVLFRDIEARIDTTGGIQFQATCARQSGSMLTVGSKVFDKLGRGHRQLLSIEDAEGVLLAERLLDASNRTFEIKLGESASGDTARTVLEFSQLGVFHILTGYDHLLFLFGLLIVGGTFQSAAKIITSFTIAHSITLALSALGFVEVAPSLVEPLIAGSILYVGVENLFRRDLKWRWLLAFGFGLIHGFGFASVIRELGIGDGGTSTIAPLFSFNLGVELGQIGIIAVTLPLIWRLRGGHTYPTRVVPALSLIISAAGAYWLIDRVI